MEGNVIVPHPPLIIVTASEGTRDPTVSTKVYGYICMHVKAHIGAHAIEVLAWSCKDIYRYGLSLCAS